MSGQFGRSWLLVFLAGWAGAAPLLAQARPAPRRTTPAGNRSSQYFARGFDLNQGPDLAVSVDGIPLNLPSTPKAPGWFDDGLLISETLAGLTYRPGAYRSDQGAFAIAGSAELATVPGFARPMAIATYGGAASDRFGRLLWADTRGGDRTVSYALEATRSYRPWRELDPSAKLNAFLRLAPRVPGQGWNLTLLASHERGDGGAPPLDAPLPPSFPKDDNPRVGDGYHFQRLFLGLNRDFRRGASRSDHLQVYGGASALRHWATSTYFLRESFWGDQLEQVDRRLFLGGEARRQWEGRQGGLAWTHRAGLQARVDRVADADVFATWDRWRLPVPVVPNSEAQATLAHAALYGQSTLRWGEGWHAFLAARVDNQRNQVFGPSPYLRQNRTATLVSPRLGLGYSPWPDAQVRLAWGQGFRLGNAFRDSRPMLRAHSADLAWQSRVLGPWHSSVTLWHLDLEGEALFDPTISALVLAGPSRRRGLEWFNEVKAGPWRAEASLAWTRARFRQVPAGQDRVPGAIARTGQLKVGWKRAPMAAQVRLRSLGAYAISPDNQVRAARQNTLDLRLERDWRDWSAAVEVSNAFSLRQHGRAYYYVSQLPYEAATLGTHTKGADPQAIRIELCRRF